MVQIKFVTLYLELIQVPEDNSRALEIAVGVKIAWPLSLAP